MCVGGIIQMAATIPEMKGQLGEYLLKDRESQSNVRLAMRAKADALARGARDEGQARQEGGQLVEQQKVAYAASGVDPTQGTPLEVMADTRLMSEQDAQTLRNNAAREAYGYQAKADQLETQRKLDRLAHHNKVSNTALTGLSRVIGGFSGGFGGG